MNNTSDRVFSFVRQNPEKDNMICLVISDRFFNEPDSGSYSQFIHNLTEDELKNMKLNLETCLKYINQK